MNRNWALFAVAGTLLGMGCCCADKHSKGCSSCRSATETKGILSPKPVTSNKPAPKRAEGVAKAPETNEPTVLPLPAKSESNGRKEIAKTASKGAAKSVEADDFSPPAAPIIPTAAPLDAKPTSEVVAATFASPTQETLAKDDHYAWVQGRLTRIASRGGFWEVRFTPHDQPDDHGGKFILVGSLPPDLSEGDLVRVEGRVGTRDARLRGTTYNVSAIRLVKKGIAPAAN